MNRRYTYDKVERWIRRYVSGDRSSSALYHFLDQEIDNAFNSLNKLTGETVFEHNLHLSIIDIQLYP